MDFLAAICRRVRDEMPEMIDMPVDMHEGVYWFCVDSHSGQGSPGYAALCASPFKPSPMGSGPSTEAARSVYWFCVHEFADCA